MINTLPPHLPHFTSGLKNHNSLSLPHFSRLLPLSLYQKILSNSLFLRFLSQNLKGNSHLKLTIPSRLLGQYSYSFISVQKLEKRWVKLFLSHWSKSVQFVEVMFFWSIHASFGHFETFKHCSMNYKPHKHMFMV